ADNRCFFERSGSPTTTEQQLLVSDTPGISGGLDSYAAHAAASIASGLPVASCWRTWFSIHVYVGASPSSSDIRGSHRTPSRRRVLSELRPRTPCGPATCFFTMLIPA